MKKIIFVGIVLVLTAFTSCDKEKSCKCVEKIGPEESTSIVETKEKCSSFNTSTTFNGITSSVTCTEE